MAARMSDEHLAWLAVRDQLGRRARRGSVLARWLGMDRRWRGTGQAVGAVSAQIGRDRELLDDGGRVNEIIGDKMAVYALAVGEVVGRLSADERRTLRETGKVPDWFLDQVELEVDASRHRPS